MEVICLQETAFFALVDKTIAHVTEKLTEAETSQWVDTEEAKQLLKVKSDTTLQKLRDEGKVRFSQPQKKWIVYDRDSIHEFLDKHAKDTF